MRQLIDEIDSGRFPGLFIVITGTPAFFDGPQGVQKLPPLASRLHTDFDAAGRFDNPRAPQIRLKAFDRPSLIEVGHKVREIFATGSTQAERIREMVSDKLVERMADSIAGELGGKVGIAPRLFLKKLVADVLDRVDLYPDFDPSRDYQLTLKADELTVEERNRTAANSVDDIPLEL